jgi:hypothetical protein
MVPVKCRKLYSTTDRDRANSTKTFTHSAQTSTNEGACSIQSTTDRDSALGAKTFTPSAQTSTNEGTCYTSDRDGALSPKTSSRSASSDGAPANGYSSLSDQGRHNDNKNYEDSRQGKEYETIDP